ncbi:MAG: hypothetical protein ACKVOJ_08075 [Sphingomonadaceae bacterium]
MDVELSGELARLVQAGTVRDNDINRLRELVWADDVLAPTTIDSLFMLLKRCEIDSPVWTDFFVEAVEHYLLHQVAPHGLLKDGGAEWLRDRIAPQGRIKTRCELELLVTVIENAENGSDRLRMFALSELETTIMTGEGPTRRGAGVREGCVDEAESVLLRRLIMGNGEEAVIVSSTDADLLFRIKSQTARSINTPSWKPLFIQAVGNHLMTHSDYLPLSVEEARRLIFEIEQQSPDLFSFLTRTLPIDMIGRGTIVEAFKSLFPVTHDPFAKTLAVESAQQFSSEAAGWLKQQFAIDPQTDEFEKALLTYIVEETGNMPAMLAGLRRHG